MSEYEKMQFFLREYLPQIMRWVAIGVVLLAIGFFIIRRFPKSAGDDKLATSDMMDAFRDLHDRGQLSDDEYRSIKTKLAARLKEELAKPDEESDSRKHSEE
jgi:uncharacterized membrane protein